MYVDFRATNTVVFAKSAVFVCLCLNSDVPVKPSAGWVHMDEVETDKLAWMNDLPTPSASDNKVCRANPFCYKLLHTVACIMFLLCFCHHLTL